MTRIRSRQFIVLAFLVAAISVSGCTGRGGASPTATNAKPTIAPTATIAPTPTLTTAELFPFSSVWHFQSQSGYKYDMTIALGKPVRVPESESLFHPLDSDFSLDSACSADPQFDVVIPGYWSGTARTVGFDTPIRMRALMRGGGTADGEYAGHGVMPFDGDNRVFVAQHFASGPSCSVFSSDNFYGYGGSDGFSVQWDNPIPAGAVRRDEFFIIIKGYFSPATPNGDFALLDWIVVDPLLGGDLDDAGMVYRDADGTWLGIYSRKGITLSGRVIQS